MTADYYDHIGLSLSALDLLLHHMQEAHALADTDPQDQRLLSTCLPSLAQLRSVLTQLERT